MKFPWILSQEAEGESYQYFDELVRPLPKNDDGTLNLSRVTLWHNDIDAFRHAYVSGVFAVEYGENAAKLAGWLNEKLNILSRSVTGDENMDHWNNAVGRELAKRFRTREALARAVKEALDNGDLIISLEDERRYEGAFLEGETSTVVVLKESETGANEVFFDLEKSVAMTRDEFVTAIEDGKYPDYGIRVIGGMKVPVSKTDGSPYNNLG